ncbi:MAG: recombinase family protein [Lachnospiraceae bacterium]|nr:recombinase family protein [Lachnospiraceae bacterium]
MSSNIENLAVVYARYSSAGQKEQSIDGQLAAAYKYAEAKGYQIVHEYIDRAMTGRNDDRDDFQRMLSDTGKHQFSVIIVWKVDRFGRNREEITFNKYRCKKNGVRVEYVAENMPEGPESVILEAVLEGMAEYYSLQLSQNVKRGLLENAKHHKAVSGTPPLGYKLTEDKHFEVDPDTAPLVRVIYEKYAAGETLFEIIRYLNNAGYKTPRGKPFARTSLDKLLKNEKYIGIYKFKDIIYDEDAVPALIDKDLFYKVQDMLEKNKRAPVKNWNYSDYLLTGKLFCGHCGDPMVGKAGHGKSGRKYDYYICKKNDKKPVRKDWIEETVLQEVHRILDDDEIFQMIVDNTWEYYLEQDMKEHEREAMLKQIADIEKGIANLSKAVEQGMPFDVVSGRLDELSGQKIALQKAIAELEIQKGFKLTKDHIQFFLEQFRSMDASDRNCEKRLISVFVNAIYVYDDKLKIAFNYSEEGQRNTVSLHDVECSHVVHSPTLCRMHTNTLSWVKCVFIINMKIAP